MHVTSFSDTIKSDNLCKMSCILREKNLFLMFIIFFLLEYEISIKRLKKLDERKLKNSKIIALMIFIC